MGLEDRTGDVAQKIESRLNEAVPFNARGINAYSNEAGAYFETIRAMRRKGYSFVQICRAFEKENVLPKNSSPRFFRQAFHRERKRREAEESLSEIAKNADVAPVKADSARPIPPAKTPEPAKPAPAGEAAEKERLRKMNSVTVNTGLGKIVKHPDGTFDLD
jgi:hypothetical protein